MKVSAGYDSAPPQTVIALYPTPARSGKMADY